ncbi:MAG: AAA family ATPase [Halobellus sp.]|uniref:AAA family ATPase n=1 Tax=Halobellus sp. TaxID=1979212 RepID=UPI0035D4E2F6
MAERERNIVGFVGATGGAGTTRTVVEVAAALAADGRRTCVVDAAFATQGLGDYVAGRLEPDVTALVTDERAADLAEGLVDLNIAEVAGRVAILPAHAPFERLARAKRVEAAQALETRIESAAAQFDHVLLDVPPVAANQAVAAVTVADSVAIVTPATERGAAATQRTHERLADVGVDAALVVSTRGTLETADVGIPATAQTDVTEPTGHGTDGGFADAIDQVAAAATGAELTPIDDGGVLQTVGEYVGR